MAFANRDINKVQGADTPVHDWYRFVLSFPPHLVRDYCERLKVTSEERVLDPFCGTGIVLVECKKLGVSSVGVEAHPMSAFASAVKVDWLPDPDELLSHATRVASAANARLAIDGRELRTMPPEMMKLLLTDSIGDIALHKTLVLLECLERMRDDRYHRHEQLALARAVVRDCSNLHFGPEVGVEPPSRRKRDAQVTQAWLASVQTMASDIRKLCHRARIRASVYQADSRQIAGILPSQSIDVVITSPPYPNEKDYTRTTRLESVLLGFIRNRAELRDVKKGLVRSNTLNVYKQDDDDRWVKEHPEIQRIAAEIEARRVEMGKTSGFERLYHRAAKLYFGGMAQHLAELRRILRPGARLAYVVGDQASYLQVLIRTGHILADIAESLGYEVTGIDLFRTRMATATRQQMREEVVLLRWPGQEEMHFDEE
ncbi:MAG: DNA methyltransferase [Chloroflexi bacterium]|nr:DNA methyltransferase [Chloroflexota bacterium]